MFHVRRELTKSEKEEYRKWRERHLRSIPPSVLNPTRAERDASASKFWARTAREQQFLLRDTPKSTSGPTEKPVEPVKVDPTLDMTEEQLEEWNRREEAARREAEVKKQRAAPVYNKGGNQYWTDDMLADLKTGAHRRRP